LRNLNITVETTISKPTEVIWDTIIDIENCANWMSNIKSIEILEKPIDGLVGLKWKEVRDFCGREASEVMWVTEAVENKYYMTRAESHGSVYTSRFDLQDSENSTLLTMTFGAEAQSFIAKVLSKLMRGFIKKSLVKEINKDLNDIKVHVEHKN